MPVCCSLLTSPPATPPSPPCPWPARRHRSILPHAGHEHRPHRHPVRELAVHLAPGPRPSSPATACSPVPARPRPRCRRRSCLRPTGRSIPDRWCASPACIAVAPPWPHGPWSCWASPWVRPRGCCRPDRTTRPATSRTRPSRSSTTSCWPTWAAPGTSRPPWAWDGPTILGSTRSGPGRRRSWSTTSVRSAPGDPGRLIGFKDPRVSLLLPFWRTVVSVRTTVVVVRAPAEVAGSLMRRNGIEPPQSALLWLRYVLGAAGNDPGHLLVVQHDFFDQLGPTLIRLADHLGLPRPTPAVEAEVAAHLDVDLQHGATADAGDWAANPLVELAERVWNGGRPDLDALDPILTRALVEGWLRPPVESQALARARAEAVSFKEQLKRRNEVVRALKQGRRPPEPPTPGRPSSTRMVTPIAVPMPTSAPGSRLDEHREPGFRARGDRGARRRSLRRGGGARPTWRSTSSARQRLIGAPVASPLEVTAVAAPLEDIAAGSSTVVQAEWAVVEATGESLRPDASPVQVINGAVAVRVGVAHAVDRRSVTVEQGTILVDPYTRTSDPFADAPIDSAGPRSRPPFRRRPVALFLRRLRATGAPRGGARPGQRTGGPRRGSAPGHRSGCARPPRHPDLPAHRIVLAGAAARHRGAGRYRGRRAGHRLVRPAGHRLHRPGPGPGLHHRAGQLDHRASPGSPAGSDRPHGRSR